MHRERNNREQGTVMVYMLICVTFLFSLGSAVTLLCNVELRASNDSTARMRAFYLADSGIQVASAELRATGTSMGATTLNETIGGHSTTIDIVPLDPNTFEVTSIGTVDGVTATVIMNMEFTATFEMEGALQINVGNGVEVTTPTLDIELNAATMISGLDHSPTGEELGDERTQLGLIAESRLSPTLRRRAPTRP